MDGRVRSLRIGPMTVSLAANIDGVPSPKLPTLRRSGALATLHEARCIHLLTQLLLERQEHTAEMYPRREKVTELQQGATRDERER